MCAGNDAQSAAACGVSPALMFHEWTFQVTISAELGIIDCSSLCLESSCGVRLNPAQCVPGALRSAGLFKLCSLRLVN